MARSLGISREVVRDHGLFHPAHVQRLQEPEHALGVFDVPAHVGVAHDVDIRADGLAHGSRPDREILVYPLKPVLWPPPEP